jgi:hypothetical protein
MKMRFFRSATPASLVEDLIRACEDAELRVATDRDPPTDGSQPDPADAAKVAPRRGAPAEDHGPPYGRGV